MACIRHCRADEADEMLAIINVAAKAYRGVIPADRWSEPYMTRAELEREIAAGVEFIGYEEAGALVGVMGLQPVRDVHLIRHAYVLPQHQGKGIGGSLLRHLGSNRQGSMLIGTWADADWAVRFYQAHGFQLVPKERVPDLLRSYWNIPERQIEASVVLAAPPIEA
jgi:N-acetylglutamate synthase-like GNAT family acetyltransferase